MKRIWRAAFLLQIVILCCLFAWVTWRQVMSERYRRPLFNAIGSNDLAQLRSAIDHGADPNARDRPDQPQRFWEVVKRMFRPKPGDRDESFATALMRAAQ